jgi:cobalt-zinc-cadmium efflux system outer membrane protein
METHFSKGAPAHLALAVLAVIFGAGVSASNAEPAPPYLVLFRQAESASPRLAESAANVRSAEGQALQATVRPNPSLGLEVENIGSSGRFSGLSNTQSTLSVNQPIELGGKRSARIAAGEAGVSAAEARNRQVAVDFGYDLAVAYAGAEVAQARTALLEDAVMAAQEDLRAARALVNAGREADLRAVQAQAAAAAAEADLESARAGALNAFAQLASLAGVPRPYTSVDASLLPRANNLPPPPAQPPAVTPAVASALAEREAAARRVTVERTRAAPDVTALFGIRRLTGDNATVFVGGVSVPLPLFDKNRGNIAASVAQLDAAEARLNAARIDAENGYRSAAAQARAAETRAAASTQAETSADEAYRLARVGYDAGRTPLIELLTTRRNLTVAQAATLEARLARITAEAALARLFGRIPFGDNP